MPERPFQVISEHRQGCYDSYLGINRSTTFSSDHTERGADTEQKKAYARIAELLAKETGVRPEDVLINLVECPRRTVGNGASYA